MQTIFEYSPAVKHALENKQPILALESTIITHGMPYPENYQTATALEQITRDHHVTPATIALIKGKIKIGLSTEELNYLAQDKSVAKASRRDLGFMVSQKMSAGTTVAATLYCAANAGIKVFATGGIGGVHRGDNGDVSADLIELARNPVAVVCAGAKAILDLPRTLEYLETHSIPIIGYRTQVLPAFYTDNTDHVLPATANDVGILSDIVKTHWQLGLASGLLIVNPIPAAEAISRSEIEPAIHSALEKAQQQNLSGKALTPFLLSEVAKITQGKSVKANIALIKNNVLLGAKLANSLG